MPKIRIHSKKIKLHGRQANEKNLGSSATQFFLKKSKAYGSNQR
jgi:hypothetical protein